MKPTKSRCLFPNSPAHDPPPDHLSRPHKLPHPHLCPGRGNSRVTTPFVARAQAELLACDEVIVMATDKAWETNGERLAAALAEARLDPVRHTIPDGRNEAELREQFRALSKEVEQAPGGAVLDITHGFRAQPFFAATALAVLAAAGDLPEDTRITYGAMEATGQDGLTPIWDLSPFLLMHELAHGVAILKRTGHGGPLTDALERERRRLAERRQKGERDEFSRAGGLKKAIEGFTRDLATLRLAALTIGTEKEPKPSSRKLLEALRDYCEACIRDHPALLPLLDDLARMAQPLPVATLHGEAGHRALVARARLYLQFDRPLEAAGVAREGFVGLFAAGPEATDAGLEIFAQAARSQAERRAMATDTGRAIADIRNDLLHAGMKKRPQPASALQANAKKAVTGFAAAPPMPPAAQSKAAPPRPLFVTRHAGAVEWARGQGIEAEPIAHLDPAAIGPGDIVLGTLPVHVAAEVCARGGRYFHLSLDLPPEARGRELSAEDMARFDARLTEFEIRSRE